MFQLTRLEGNVTARQTGETFQSQKHFLFLSHCNKPEPLLNPSLLSFCPVLPSRLNNMQGVGAFHNNLAALCK